MKKLTLLFAVFFLAGCKPTVHDVFLHIRPNIGEVMAGRTIDVFATTYPVVKTATYKWSVKANCKVAMDAKGPKVTLKPDKFCVQQDATAVVTVTANGKSVKKSKKFSILEASDLPPRLDLNPKKTGWLMINDYADSAHLKTNNMKATVSTWAMGGGLCKPEIEKGVMKLGYTLPLAGSMCGVMNYLAGEKGESKPYDISKYGRVSVKLRSGDGKRHEIRVIVVEYDAYQTANQGLVGESKPLIVLEDRWWRYELPLKYTLPELFDRTRTKGIGLKIKGKEGEKGSILVDDLALIPGEGK